MLNFENGCVFPTEEELKLSTEHNLLYKNSYVNLYPDIRKLDGVNLDIEDTNYLDIVTFSSFNVDILYNHCKSIKKYIKTPHYHTVFFDGQMEKTKCGLSYKISLIKEMCDEIGCNFINIPCPFYNKQNLNVVQGILFNYVFYEYIKKRNCRYFGFLDYDIFFYDDVDIRNYMKFNCCGKIHSIYNEWFLWGGYSFHELEYFKDLDYTANHWSNPGYEAGYRNYFIYYYKYKNGVDLNIDFRGRYINIFSDEVISPEDLKNTTCSDRIQKEWRSTHIEDYGHCYHFLNGSDWNMVGDVKMDNKWKKFKYNFLNEK